jgi:hypothetical protein
MYKTKYLGLKKFKNLVRYNQVWLYLFKIT